VQSFEREDVRMYQASAIHVTVRQCVRCATLCCAVLCCAVLCCAVLCCAVLCCAVLCCAVLCCAVPVLCCAVLCCAVLCCAVLCCAVLCCCAARVRTNCVRAVGRTRRSRGSTFYFTWTAHRCSSPSRLNCLVRTAAAAAAAATARCPRWCGL
jgi:hypothetical protein